MIWKEIQAKYLSSSMFMLSYISEKPFVLVPCVEARLGSSLEVLTTNACCFAECHGLRSEPANSQIASTPTSLSPSFHPESHSCLSGWKKGWELVLAHPKANSAKQHAILVSELQGEDPESGSCRNTLQSQKTINIERETAWIFFQIIPVHSKSLCLRLHDCWPK